MSSTAKLAWVGLVALAVAGCGAAQESASQSAFEPLTIGADDAADTTCNVVLRSMQRPPGQQGGYEIAWVNGAGWYVWSGFVDVSAEAAADASAVGVLYSSGHEWRESDATAVDGAPAGFVRYQVRLTEGTVSYGTSLSSLMRTRIEVAPFVRGASGGRLFDHNRNSDPFANYVLDSNNGWVVRDDSSICPAKTHPRSVVQFQGGWTTQQHAALVAGGTLSIEYDLARLPDCRATHNGYPAWDTVASVRFSPGGELLEGSVRAFETVNGTPTNVAHSAAFDVAIPQGATSAEIWFHNYSGAGNNCQAWDSNLGQNYRFEVLAQAPAAIGWAGNWGGSFDRACEHHDGLVEPVVIDDYIMERACAYVDAEVYVPGLTDGGEHPERIAAQVEYSIDDLTQKQAWLEFVGRVGNNYRYRWTLPRSDMANEPWAAYRFDFRFSTDGETWFRIGRDEGPAGGEARTIQKGF